MYDHVNYYLWIGNFSGKMNGEVVQGAAEGCAGSSPVLGVLSQLANLKARWAYISVRLISV